jgi:hypothetical protein
MQAVSQEFKDALNVSHTDVRELTVTVPGGDPYPFDVSAASITSSNDTGVRMSASLTVIPQPGVDLYSILSTPGAQFHIRYGIDFGPGDPEMIPMGVYEASQGSIDIIEGEIAMSLVDRWACIERARFSAPVTVEDGDFTTRALLVKALVDTAFFVDIAPPDGIIIEAGGGTPSGQRVFDRDRAQAIKDVAADGSLDVYFDPAGVFIIREQPILDASNIVWTFRTGESGNITTADRERPFDRLYNCVVVNPIDEEQTWTTVTIFIEDTANPRHPNNLGEVVPYFYSSPTITNSTEALAAANTILQRIQGTTETVNISGLGAPMLEVGDTITIVHEATPSDPGFAATHIIDGWTFDLLTGGQSLATRSTSLVDAEEV